MSKYKSITEVGLVSMPWEMVGIGQMGLVRLVRIPSKVEIPFCRVFLSLDSTNT